MGRYPTRGDVEVAFGQSAWALALSNPLRACAAKVPQLYQLDRIYGNGSAAHWIQFQLVNLFVLADSKDKEKVDAIRSYAPLMAATMMNYKLSEIVLFFAGYATGRYGVNDWKDMDLRRIASAFHRDFLPVRLHYVDEIERARQHAEMKTKLGMT